MSDDPTPSAPPTTAEDLKRNKALSSMEESPDTAASSTTNNTDSEALGKAVLDIPGAGAAGGKAAVGGGGNKAVKISSEDVNLIIEHFELSRPKATEALRKNGGDLKATVRSLLLV